MSSETAYTLPFQVFESSFIENQEDLFSLVQSPIPSPEPDSSNSGSGQAGRASTAVEDRKRRRKLSNRESARRSRMRKQKHFEELRNEVYRLRIENREMANRLALLSSHCQLVWRDNERLMGEASRLRQWILDVQQELIMRQLQQIVSSNEQIPQLVA